VRALSKLGFRIAREGKHTILSDGKIRLTIPRHNPINAFTMADIAKDAGLTPEQFLELL
jgi:predicted RNA binding protein YcfA (HicA-like mRNA interferase family)